MKKEEKFYLCSTEKCIKVYKELINEPDCSRLKMICYKWIEILVDGMENGIYEFTGNEFKTQIKNMVEARKLLEEEWDREKREEEEKEEEEKRRKRREKIIEFRTFD